MGVAQFSAGQRVRASDLNQLPVVVSYLTTGSVSNSIAETVIGTFTIPAGDPTFPGGYSWNLWASTAASGSPTLTIRLRFNGLAGTLMCAPGAITHSAATSAFGIQGYLGFEAIGTAGTFGTFSQFGHFFGSNGLIVPGLADNVAVNTTVANTIVVTAQWSVASASNTATTKFGSLYRL